MAKRKTAAKATTTRKAMENVTITEQGGDGAQISYSVVCDLCGKGLGAWLSVEEGEEVFTEHKAEEHPA